MNFLDAKKGLARKLNIDFDDIALNDLFTEADLEDYVNQGAMAAWDYRFWDFAEESKTGTLTSTEITNGYVAHPTTLAPSSAFLLKINSKAFRKLEFRDYQKFLEDHPSSTDRYWSEFKRLIFFNAGAAAIGQEIEIWGKKNFTELTGASDLMPFSPSTDAEQYSGNQAVVHLAYAEALASDKKKNPTQAEVERKKAYGILDVLWNQFTEGRSAEQSKDRPQFEVPDFFKGNSGRGVSGIGTFSV